MANVLVASLGESPAVVTATIIALAKHAQIHIAKLVTIYPAQSTMISLGKDYIDDIWINVWKRNAADHIAYPLPCADVNTYASTELFLHTVRGMLAQHHYAGDTLYVSISGGRKNMSAVMLAPAQAFSSVRGVYHVHDQRLKMHRNLFPSIEELFDVGEHERRQWLQPAPEYISLVEIPFRPLPDDARQALEDFVQQMERSGGQVRHLSPMTQLLLCQFGLIQPCNTATPHSFELTQRGLVMLPLVLDVALHDSFLPDAERFNKVFNGEHYNNIPEVRECTQHIVQKLVQRVKAIEDVIGRHCSRAAAHNSRLDKIEFGRVSPSNPRQVWKVGVWIYERERACLVEFLSTARSSLEAVELWRRIQPLLPNMRDPEQKAVLIASLGDHAAIVTEAYQILKQQGVKLTSVAWIYPGSNSRIAWLSNALKRVLDKEQVETLPVPLVGCEDVDSQGECDRFLEKMLEQITAFSERQYAVHLSLAGGRKAMSAMMFLAAQKTRVAGLYHVLLNDSEVEHQLLRDTSYEALYSATPSKQRQLLLMDDKKIEQVVDLINVPFLTNEAVQ